MKKLILGLLAVLPCLIAFKCVDSFESPKNFTPYKLLSKNDYPGEITYSNKKRTDTEGILREEILKIEKYKNIKELKTPSNKYFVYDLRTNGIGFFINMGAVMAFYDDGYVDVDPPEGYSSLKDHYYYSFDVEEAKPLFEFVKEYFTISQNDD